MQATESSSNVVKLTQFRRYRPQEQEKETPPTPPREKELVRRYGDYNYYYYNNNTRRAGARARNSRYSSVPARDEAAQFDISQAFGDAFGRQIPPVIMREINHFMHVWSAEPALICEILAYTTGAPAPSWAYARAVINNSVRAGITTQLEFLDALSARRAARRVQSCPTAADIENSL